MASPPAEGFNMDPEVLEPGRVDREDLLAVRWALGCQEVHAGVVKKSIIRQIWLPGEWLSNDDHESEMHPRHGKEYRNSRAGAPANAGSAATTSRAAGTQAKEEPPVQEPEVVAAEVKGDEGEHSSSPLPGGKQSDGSTGAGSNCAFDTSSNSSKESSSSKDAASSKDQSAARNVINISNCITGDNAAGAEGKTISLDASINAEQPKRAPTAEEQATAALSAMLGLGKPKVKVAPTPPPRTPLWRPPRSSLNPNAAEFRPMGDGYGPWPPAEAEPVAEKEPVDIPEEMTTLLGVNLLDEICGAPPGPGVGALPARTDVGPVAEATASKTTTTI